LGNDNRQLAIYNGFSDICSGFDEKYLYASDYLTYGIGREPALAMDYDGGIKYYVCDHLGSVRTIFDEDGNVLSDHEYEPFGNEFFDSFGIGKSEFGIRLDRSFIKLVYCNSWTFKRIFHAHI
jgi:hypothetical protein